MEEDKEKLPTERDIEDMMTVFKNILIQCLKVKKKKLQIVEEEKKAQKELSDIRDKAREFTNKLMSN